VAQDQPMTSVIECQIRKEKTTVNEWLSVWHERAEDARIGEPETSAYAAAINTEDELNILVFERYAKGDSSMKWHNERSSNDTFAAAMVGGQMTKRRVFSSMFTDVPNCGWWGRPQTHAEDTKDAILMLRGLHFETDAMRDAFIRATERHAAYCWDNEPDTLIYSLGVASDDADREVDLKKGDIVCVMAWASTDALERHRVDPNRAILELEYGENGIHIEILFTRYFKTTGRGFLWR